MEAIRETTNWSTPNHTYLLDGSTLIAYIKQGTQEPIYFSKGMKNFDRRRRTFVPADQSLFTKLVATNLIEVQGSKGKVYLVDPEAHSCTCPGYTFRGNCKHIDILVDNVAA